jgi:endo-1,4-beta-D-glucanase Y
MSIKKMFSAALVCAALASIAFGQTASYPFPQNVVYPNGHSQSTITDAKTTDWYNKWKTAFIQTCPNKGVMPMDTDDNAAKVEAMGWAMIATAYMGDKATFDDLYKFYNANTNSRAGGMMVWKVTCDNIPDNEGSATDGDLDVAFALVVASWQWGGDYLDEAKKVITKCEQLIITCANGGPNGTAIRSLAGGYSGGPYGGACNSYTDLSYYTPAFFRVFAEVSGKDIWNQLADDTYIHLERNAHPTTGLISDWQNVNTGEPVVGPSNQEHDKTYRHDASRVAWRISLDYLWNGNAQAKAWLTKVTGWVVNTLGVDNLKEGHNRDGSVTNQQSAGMAFLGSFAVGSLANDEAGVRTALINKIATRDDSYWYHRHTGNMYLLAITGNMWNEAMVGGDGFRLLAQADGGGSVKRVPNKTRYESGETVQITAEANTGWEFVEWSGDIGSADSKSPTISIAMSADKNVTAKFALTGGVELVKNGDFANGTADWELNTWENSQATFSASNGTVTININTLPGDGKIYNLQMVQASLPLLKGNTYTVSFEASAASSRTIEVMAQKATDPWTGYFSEEIELTTTMKEFSFEFEMEEDDDLVSRLGFNVGNSTDNVSIRNISVMLKQNVSVKLKQSIPTTATKGSSLRVSAKKTGINVKFKAKNSGAAELRLYGLKGDLVAKTSLKTVAGKTYTHTFSAKSKLPNGFYIVSVNNNGVIERSRAIMPK